MFIYLLCRCYFRDKKQRRSDYCQVLLLSVLDKPVGKPIFSTTRQYLLSMHMIWAEVVKCHSWCRRLSCWFDTFGFVEVVRRILPRQDARQLVLSSALSHSICCLGLVCAFGHSITKV